MSNDQSRPNDPSEKLNNENEKKEKAWLLWIQGNTQTQIAKELDISQPSISRWLSELMEKGKQHMEDLANEGIGFLLHETVLGLNLVISTAWELYREKQSEKILKLLGDLYLQRSKLLADMDLADMRRNAGKFIWATSPLETKIKIRKNENQENNSLMLAGLGL